MTIRSGGSYVVDPTTGEERRVEGTADPIREPDPVEPGAATDPDAETARAPRRSDKTKE